MDFDEGALIPRDQASSLPVATRAVLFEDEMKLEGLVARGTPSMDYEDGAEYDNVKWSNPIHSENEGAEKEVEFDVSPTGAGGKRRASSTVGRSQSGHDKRKSFDAGAAASSKDSENSQQEELAMLAQFNMFVAEGRKKGRFRQNGAAVKLFDQALELFPDNAQIQAERNAAYQIFNPNSEMISQMEAGKSAKVWAMASALFAAFLAAVVACLYLIAAMRDIDHLYSPFAVRALIQVSEKYAVIASGSHPYTRTSNSAAVQLWEVTHGGQAVQLASLVGHKSWVSAIAYFPKTQILASGSDDSTIHL